MKYRKLGKTGIDVSSIGFGLEHIAVGDMAPALGCATDHGVNYLDLMIWAEDRKAAFAQAMEGRRNDFVLAGHIGVAETNGQYRKSRDLGECEDLWRDWLLRLKTDCMDIVFLTYVDEPDEYEQVIGAGGIIELARRYREEGSARYTALSGHSYPIASRAVEDGIVDLVMVPVDMSRHADEDLQHLIQLCVQRSVGLVAMKAFNGGNLLKGDSPAEPLQCIHYVATRPGLSTCLVGAGSLQEFQTDMGYMEADHDALDFSAALRSQGKAPEGQCTYCHHCLPCTEEIEIPAVIGLLENASGGVTGPLQEAYDALPVPASACVACEECESRCPFGVEIVEKMEQAAALFESQV